MKLSECTMGRVVCTINTSGEIERIGMITGITNNCQSGDLYVRADARRAIPLVKWSCGSEHAIHHTNIFPLEKFEHQLRN